MEGVDFNTHTTWHHFSWIVRMRNQLHLECSSGDPKNDRGACLLLDGSYADLNVAQEIQIPSSAKSSEDLSAK
eukprot:361554-Pelagomonas_calceolata.AAC.5